MPPDWTNFYFEEKQIDYESYYEYLAEREDERWEDNCEEED